MALRKTNNADIKGRYPLYVQVGMIASLGLLIIALKLDLHQDSTFEIQTVEQEIIEMEEIEQTKQEVKPPPPLRPPVPIEVPNDEELEDDALDLDASLDIDEPLANLSPPPELPEEEDEEPEIFVIVEQMPELIGGLAGLQKNIKYPEIAKRANVSGRVFVQFIVDEQGNVIDPVVTRGIGAGCDEEAIRAVRMAKFKPGRQRGTNVRVKMSLPITFRLK